MTAANLLMVLRPKTESYIDVNLAQDFDPLVAKDVQRVLRFLQVFFFETHAREALPGQYIR
jgi:hypothetical protein